MVARFKLSPKETHVIAIKRILKYLKGTMEHGLWYPKGQDFILKAFTHADQDLFPNGRMARNQRKRDKAVDSVDMT